MANLGMLDRIKLNVDAVRAMGQAGLLKPKVALTATQALKTWGPTLAAGYVASAKRSPSAIGIIDDEGSLTFAEIDDLSNRLAIVLAGRKIGPQSPVGVLCRNSRWFAICTAALNKLGATVLYMNTGFAGPQLADVMQREGGVLRLMARGLSDAEIAGELALDVGTVTTDVAAVLAKTGSRGRTQAVVAAYSSGFVDPRFPVR